MIDNQETETADEHNDAVFNDDGNYTISPDSLFFFLIYFISWIRIILIFNLFYFLILFHFVVALVNWFCMCQCLYYHFSFDVCLCMFVFFVYAEQVKAVEDNKPAEAADEIGKFHYSFQFFLFLAFLLEMLDHTRRKEK